MSWLSKLTQESSFCDIERRVLKLEVEMELMKKIINTEQVVIDKKGAGLVSSNTSNVEG